MMTLDFKKVNPGFRRLSIRFFCLCKPSRQTFRHYAENSAGT